LAISRCATGAAVLRLLLMVAAAVALLAAPADRRPATARGTEECTNAPPLIDPSAPPDLKRAFEQVPPLVTALVSNTTVPGISVGVIYDQRLVFAIGAGCADREMNVPAGPGTVYRIESVTKLFEAMEMMQQRDAGKYQVSDAVASYVPEVSYSYNVPNLGTTTTWYPSFLELASHTAGLPDAVPTLSGSSSEQIEQFWQYLNAQTVTTPRAYQYSDLGTVAMGQAAALIAGYNNRGTSQAYHQYVMEQILRPLGMTASTFAYETVPPRDLAIPYLASGQSWTPATDALTFNFPLAGDVFTSVQDMAKFISLQFKTGPAGGPQILTCTSIQEMWQPVAPTGSGGYVGTGWFILPPPPGVSYQVLSKNGGSQVFSALVQMIPEVRLGIVAFTNHGGVASSLSDLEDAMFGLLAPTVSRAFPTCGS